MSLAQIQLAASEALHRLDIPAGLTLDELQLIVEDDRGKSIAIKQVKSLGNDQLSGLWLSLPDTELILHAETSPIHRQQIILHEFAHMLLGHDELMQDSKYVRSLLPDLDNDMVVKALSRCDHLDDIEVAAESLADMLAARLATSRRLSQQEPLNFGKIFG
jgi:DNA-directed RNA polymerase specialized sigma54-like protein